MISQLRGTVTTLNLNSVVLDVGGVGYLVNAVPRTLGELTVGQEATLPTSLVVREDSMTLYGFTSARDRDVFDIITSVSGIGPKLGLAILAVHSAEELAAAVQNEDTKALTRVSGVGPKSASRIILELKGKLTLSADATATAAPAAQTEAEALAQAAEAQVVEGLTGLGWTEKEAKKVLAATLKAQPELAGASVPELLRAALRGVGAGTGVRS
ncbi:MULTISPECIES: Holliday junction branch migration protein RuvA [Micrococcaceae]|uniref:Holliday junction branch migration complex subunit RuvA n=2 Tax=Pseudoglutamicibacter albus TaxID=98671 RepID=A0A095YFE9_9MICC|nr:MULTISPECIES: Holliday junction branch migration protein RuvA [Micrococcaceae]KGF20806.1 ATP-dependent DNA helicase RuvA [Pseudoglutamicibacter albus DNF00011]MDR7293556.1 Holliday junction DNA helicase RuvA [Pseudoglutamicibacter albus]OFT22299.1 Holliday junction DNA helicase RuvA [Arthrobacter sp. HMSC08H08]OFT41142.1 Holliday junction DNA helicase RuvA [Arthrobacter sp. HMSC06H05]